MTAAIPRRTAAARTDRRRPIHATDRVLVWTRAGGCCELCGRYLAEGPLTRRADLAGELAHIVGQGTGPGSPRGQVDMPAEARDKAANLMLVCRSDHREIDRDGSLDAVTIKWLQDKKATHEARIRRVVALAEDQHSAVLRLIGDVDTAVGQITLETAADAIFRAGRYPDFAGSYDQAGIAINVREIPGEANLAEAYWVAARQRIDEGVRRLRDGLRADTVRHVSVFAFARIPLLVYLGAALDDTFTVDIYQRHRLDQTWNWKDTDAAEFRANLPAELGEEAVLILNVSGTVDPTELEGPLATLPRITVETATPGVDVMASRASLQNFETTIRDLFARLEAPTKALRRLHVVGALPISAAVALGRAHSSAVHPSLVLYARKDQRYHLALEIP
jgi:SMODS-associated and fused to various effectors sensor domain